MDYNFSRTRTETGWQAQCDHCNKWFESKRGDAHYCSGKCRTAATRAKQKRLQNIEEAKWALKKVLRETPMRGDSPQYRALMEMRAEIERKLSWIESE